MGAIEDLAAALTGPAVRQKIDSANPYLQIAKIPDAVPGLTAQVVARDPGAYSMQEALAPALVSGLLSGFLQGAGEDYSATLNDRYQRAAVAAANGMAPDPEAYLPPSLLTDATNAASIFKARTALEDAQKDRDMRRQVDQQIQFETNPQIARQKLLFADVAAGNLTTDEAIAQLNSGRGSSGGTDIATPVMNETSGGSSSLKEYADALGVPYAPGLTKKLIKERSDLIKGEEDAARSEILTGSKYPAVQKLQVTSTALAQLKNIKDLDSSSSDIPFATLFIGGLDGSVVREGEYDRVKGANPLLTKFQNQIEGALNGKSSLGVEIKQKMYRELVETQKGLQKEALKQLEPRLKTALSRGAKEENILPFDRNMKFDDGGLTFTRIPEGAVPIPGRTSGGKQVYDLGGKMWVPD